MNKIILSILFVVIILSISWADKANENINSSINEVGSAEPGEHQKAILEILFNDLKEWLFRHMLDEDLKMTEYFNLEKNHRVEDNSEE